MKNKQLFLALVLGATMPAMYGMEALQNDAPKVVAYVQNLIEPNGVVDNLTHGRFKQLNAPLRELPALDIINALQRFLITLQNNLPTVLMQVESLNLGDYTEQAQNALKYIKNELSGNRLATVSAELDSLKSYLDSEGHLSQPAVDTIIQNLSSVKLNGIKKELSNLWSNKIQPIAEWIAASDRTAKLQASAASIRKLAQREDLTTQDVDNIATAFGLIRRLVGTIGALGTVASTLNQAIKQSDAKLPTELSSAVTFLQDNATSIENKLNNLVTNIKQFLGAPLTPEEQMTK